MTSGCACARAGRRNTSRCATRRASPRTAQKIELMINAGLTVDLPHLEETGAEGIGLFRTEFQFMVAGACRAPPQTPLPRGARRRRRLPVTFRTLDIGGDKVLPYMRTPRRRTRPSAGAPSGSASTGRGCLRLQMRALLARPAGRDLKVMFPMIATVDEFRAAKALIERELTHLRSHGHELPERVEVGAMLEVPSLLFQLDELLERVDFLSVGSNDLVQFLYAADRGNSLVGVPFRSDLGAGPARAQANRRQGEGVRQAGDALRRDGVAADRRAGADRVGLSLALAHGLGDRTRQGDDPRPRHPQGQQIAGPADRQPGFQRANPANA